MNRFFSFLLSCILLLTCTACVSPVSAANDGSDTPSHITPEHDEQLLHGSRPQLPSQSDPLPEKDPEVEPVTPAEPEASEPSSQEPTAPDPVQPPTTDPESTDGTQTESTPVPESPRTIDPSKPMVALTFDDGPNATYSDMILDILEENNAVATFFEVGRNVANCPQPLTRMVELGCEIGSHSYVHKDLSKLSSDALAKDMAAADQAFIDAVGFAPTLLRPPYGAVNSSVKHDTGHSVITWTVDTEDWKSRDTDKIVSYVKSLPSLDGEVVLLHSSYETTVDAVKILVPWLIQQGYQLVTVSELMAYYYGELMQPGQFYGYTYFTTHGKTDTPAALPEPETPAAGEDTSADQPQEPQQPDQQTPPETAPQPVQPEESAPEPSPETPEVPAGEEPVDETLPIPEKPTIPASPDAPIYSTLPAEVPSSGSAETIG